MKEWEAYEAAKNSLRWNLSAPSFKGEYYEKNWNERKKQFEQYGLEYNEELFSKMLEALR